MLGTSFSRGTRRNWEGLWADDLSNLSSVTYIYFHCSCNVGMGPESIISSVGPSLISSKCVWWMVGWHHYSCIHVQWVHHVHISVFHMSSNVWCRASMFTSSIVHFSRKIKLPVGCEEFLHVYGRSCEMMLLRIRSRTCLTYIWKFPSNTHTRSANGSIAIVTSKR